MTAERQPLAKLFRFAISILLLAHLLAVVLPPLSFQTRGPIGQSPSVATAFAPLEGYSQFLYIDRGYAFFAPDPGPSHLIQAAVTESNGRQVEKMFPDLQEQWPRLLYHRHFMLAEFLEEIYQPPGPPPELVEVDREEAEYWVRTRARYEHVRQSIVEHLKHENPGEDVAIRRIEHLIPDVIEFQLEPIELTDPRLYRVMLDQPIEVGTSGDLAAPAGPPETIPPPQGAVVAPGAESANSSEPKIEPESNKKPTPDAPEAKAVVTEKTNDPVSEEPNKEAPISKAASKKKVTENTAIEEQTAEPDDAEPTSEKLPTDDKPGTGKDPDVTSEATEDAVDAVEAAAQGDSL